MAPGRSRSRPFPERPQGAETPDEDVRVFVPRDIFPWQNHAAVAFSHERDLPRKLAPFPSTAPGRPRWQMASPSCQIEQEEVSGLERDHLERALPAHGGAVPRPERGAVQRDPSTHHLQPRMAPRRQRVRDTLAGLEP
jgi:hypothetical protein